MLHIRFHTVEVCPSQEGMNRGLYSLIASLNRLPLAGGDESGEDEAFLFARRSAPRRRG